MSIKDQIEKYIGDEKDEKTQQFWKECKKIVEDIIQHNKQITGQMSVYDIHDEQHSEEVL